MRNYLIKSFFLMALSIFLFSNSTYAATPIEKQTDKLSKAESSQTHAVKSFKQNIIKEKVKSLSFKEKRKLFKEFRKQRKIARKSGVKSTPVVVLYILAVILPPVAVGLFTDWGEPTLWNLLFTILFWIPGIVHAFYILLA